MISRLEGAIQVVGEDVRDFFPQVLPFLERALRHANGELTLSDVLELAEKGIMQLWICYAGDKVETVMTTEISDFPSRRVVRVVTLAGRIAPYLHIWKLLQEWALMHGAEEIEAWCRPAMTRLLRRYGFAKRYEIVRYDLRRKLQ